MEIIIFAGGVIVGSVITSLLNKCNKTYGVIKIDHGKQLVSVQLSREELIAHNPKKAIFDVDHNAVLYQPKISRNEQSL